MPEVQEKLGRDDKVLTLARLLSYPEAQELRYYILERASLYARERELVLREQPSLDVALKIQVYNHTEAELRAILSRFQWTLEEAQRIYKRRAMQDGYQS